MHFCRTIKSNSASDCKLGCFFVFFGFVFTGVPGLLIAKELIQQNIETNVCLLEKEDHFGGRIYDHTFQQHVPDVSVGKCFQWY